MSESVSTNIDNLNVDDTLVGTLVNAIVPESSVASAATTNTITDESSTNATSDDIPTNDSASDISSAAAAPAAALIAAIASSVVSRTKSWTGLSQEEEEEEEEEVARPSTLSPQPTVVTQKDIPEPVNKETDWFSQMQYIIFHNELINLKKGNMIILKECSESKRLLDLKFADLTNKINSIQTSVIFPLHFIRIL